MSGNDISLALNQWSGYVLAKKALMQAGVVRSFKAAEADFSEWLVAKLLGGSLPPSKSYPGCDVLAPGKRVQVKSVCKAPGNPNGYIVTAKDRSNNAAAGASHYAFVFFTDLVPASAFLLPEDVVRLWARGQIRRPDVENHPKGVRLWLIGENV